MWWYPSGIIIWMNLFQLKKKLQHNEFQEHKKSNSIDKYIHEDKPGLLEIRYQHLILRLWHTDILCIVIFYYIAHMPVVSMDFEVWRKVCVATCMKRQLNCIMWQDGRWPILGRHTIQLSLHIDCIIHFSHHHERECGYDFIRSGNGKRFMPVTCPWFQ